MTVATRSCYGGRVLKRALPRRWRPLARWTIALSAMAFVVHRLASEPEALRRVLSTDPAVLLGVAGLIVASQALMSNRFALAVELCGGRPLPALTWFRLISVGQMLNLFAPQLGTIYRGVTLKREHGISYMSYASGLFAFVWLDLIAGLAIALLVIALLDPGLRLGALPGLPLAAVALIVLVLAPFFTRWLLSLVRVKSAAITKIQSRMTTLLGSASRLLHSRAVVSFLFVNVLVTLDQVATLWLLFHSVASSPPIATLLLFQVLLKLSNQIMITPGNLGITELLFGLLAYGAEFSVEQGLAVALLNRVIGMIVVILLGVICGGAGWLSGDRREDLKREKTEGAA
jgi:uncharacterized membrane protein YbhN (UPF0104 family)